MPNIDQLKRDAKRLKKAESITHSEALDRIAVQQGYNNWPSLMKAKEGHHDRHNGTPVSTVGE